MKGTIAIVFLTAAIMAALPSAALADADGDEAPAPYFVRGPRIIHVPQLEESDERVEYRAKIRADSVGREKTGLPRYRSNEAIAPQPHRHVAPAEHRRAELPPRRKPFSASPQPAPAGPPRAVLSAPTPRASELAPIYPTPRFEAKADADEAPRPHETAAAAKAPPSAPNEPNEPNDQ